MATNIKGGNRQHPLDIPDSPYTLVNYGLMDVAALRGDTYYSVMVMAFTRKWCRQTLSGEKPKAIAFGPDDVKAHGVGETTFRNRISWGEGIFWTRTKSGGGKGRHGNYDACDGWKSMLASSIPPPSKVSPGDTNGLAGASPDETIASPGDTFIDSRIRLECNGTKDTPSSGCSGDDIPSTCSSLMAPSRATPEVNEADTWNNFLQQRRAAAARKPIQAATKADAAAQDDFDAFLENF